MKRYLILVLSIVLALSVLFKPNEVNAEEKSQEEIVNEILEGVNEEDFNFLLEFLSSFTNKNLTFKELVLSFLTGDFSSVDISFNSFKNSIINSFNRFGGRVIIYLLIIGILFNLANIISLKNTDNTLKNAINYISISIALILLFKVVEIVFSYTASKLEFLSKTVEIAFPTMFSISGLIGNFGVSVLKPFTAFLSFLISVLSVKLFLPLLYFETSVSAISNLSDTVKLSGLKKTTSAIYKWLLLLILGVYSLSIGSQSLVNAQYNGISVKILKYLTNSTVPIVGGFLSGGMEVLISSAVLIKNSIGLLSIVAVILNIGASAIEILIFSFMVKFFTSVCESVLDEKYYKTLTSVTDVFNGLAGLLLISGFVFIITVLFVISATAFIF